jgi:hypothetical protein
MIEPITYRKSFEGKSNAHLITFSDGRDYVVKYFQPGFEKTLPNEWVSYCLGRYLGLPIPFAQIVEIPEEFTSKIPELAQRSLSKYQFASLYVSGCGDWHQVNTIFHITNRESLASIILFDYWLANKDRTRKNILLREESLNSFQLWAIDHAEVFDSYNWMEQDLERLPAKEINSATHQLIALFIENEHEFIDQLELIQTIPILLIEEIVALIPEEWLVTKEERKAIVSTLLTRRKRILPGLMRNFIKKTYRPLHENQG